MKNQRGFTLLEMMVVVAIIAILAAILIPNFTRARAQAQTAACLGNMKTIATALELYYTDNETYPPNLAKTPVDSTFAKTMDGYLNQIPVDPAAGAGKYYEISDSQTSGVWSYTIWCPGAHDPATLQNISPGTTDTTLQYDSKGGFSTTTAQGS